MSKTGAEEVLTASEIFTLFEILILVCCKGRSARGFPIVEFILLDCSKWVFVLSDEFLSSCSRLWPSKLLSWLFSVLALVELMLLADIVAFKLILCVLFWIFSWFWFAVLCLELVSKFIKSSGLLKLLKLPSVKLLLAPVLELCDVLLLLLLALVDWLFTVDKGVMIVCTYMSTAGWDWFGLVFWIAKGVSIIGI